MQNYLVSYIYGDHRITRVVPGDENPLEYIAEVEAVGHSSWIEIIDIKLTEETTRSFDPISY